MPAFGRPRMQTNPERNDIRGISRILCFGRPFHHRVTGETRGTKIDWSRRAVAYVAPNLSWLIMCWVCFSLCLCVSVVKCFCSYHAGLGTKRGSYISFICRGCDRVDPHSLHAPVGRIQHFEAQTRLPRRFRLFAEFAPPVRSPGQRPWRFFAFRTDAEQLIETVNVHIPRNDVGVIVLV